MRLGVVGMMPADFRDITAAHLSAIADLRLTGAASHAPIAGLTDVTAAQCASVRATMEAADMDFVQFGLGYGQCLFDPDPAVTAPLLDGIGRGIEVAAQLQAHYCLIRTGSLNDRGSYSATAANHRPECRDRLTQSLRTIADKAEAAGVTMVIETHLLTIMDSPETNAAVLAAVGSDHMRVVMDCCNHFQAVHQVYASRARLDHIFQYMGPIAGCGHLKDAAVRDGFVSHIDEEVPGEGDLDLGYLLQLWQKLDADAYMLLEHLPDEKYPLAAKNAHRIAAAAGVEVH
ncbi:MAG: sugar phosphate isomerase/epimerase [bacterium]|nr:sugar phosphate isomerase/epimerase [bacterium]